MDEKRPLSDDEYLALKGDIHELVEELVDRLGEAGVDVSYYPEQARKAQEHVETKLAVFVNDAIQKYC